MYVINVINNKEHLVVNHNIIIVNIESRNNLS